MTVSLSHHLNNVPPLLNPAPFPSLYRIAFQMNCQVTRQLWIFAIGPESPLPAFSLALPYPVSSAWPHKNASPFAIMPASSPYPCWEYFSFPSIPWTSFSYFSIKIQLRKKNSAEGTSLMVQWLRLLTPNAGSPGSVPGQGTRSRMPKLRVRMPQLKILHAATKTQCNQINIKK